MARVPPAVASVRTTSSAVPPVIWVDAQCYQVAAPSTVAPFSARPGRPPGGRRGRDLDGARRGAPAASAAPPPTWSDRVGSGSHLATLLQMLCSSPASSVPRPGNGPVAPVDQPLRDPVGHETVLSALIMTSGTPARDHLAARHTPPKVSRVTELPVLAPEEQRILGSLLEKQTTVPATYPLTANALRTACNQTSNRDPVVDLDQETDRADRAGTQGARAAPDRLVRHRAAGAEVPPDPRRGARSRPGRAGPAHGAAAPR